MCEDVLVVVYVSSLCCVTSMSEANTHTCQVSWVGEGGGPSLLDSLVFHSTKCYPRVRKRWL